MILLIDNYDSFTYNLVQYLGDLGAVCTVRRNDRITVAEAMALKPRAIVLSPGPRTPAEAGICCDLIRAAGPTIPLLGVCLGHQAIGHVYGGVVKRAGLPMHGKVSTIRTVAAPNASGGVTGLFDGLPARFDVTRYHSLIVDRATLPADLIVTAEATDGTIMGLAHRTHPVHGVQFHPESIASEHGHALLANFLTLAGLSPRRRNAPGTRAA